MDDGLAGSVDTLGIIKDDRDDSANERMPETSSFHINPASLINNAHVCRVHQVTVGELDVRDDGQTHERHCDEG